MSITSNRPSGTVIWQSPSNIALIKYWGKHGEQLPENPSVSFTLSKSYSRTKIAYRPKSDFEDQISFTFKFDGKEQLDFSSRIRQYLVRVRNDFPSLRSHHLDIESSNSFPHSAGIASSASAFSALALALSDVENQISNPGAELNLTQSSSIARLGSGSACRSLFPIASLWGKVSSVENSSDLHAIPMRSHVHETFKTYQDSILIVSQESKKVSSSVGHSLMKNHPFARVRYEEAKRNLQQMLEALKFGDLERMGFLTEMEAMQLHALMMCSNPNFILLQPNTLRIIEGIKSFRQDTKIPVYFTLDAGPNVHILYPNDHIVAVQSFIRNYLLEYCAKQQWIDDAVGGGPIKME